MTAQSSKPKKPCESRLEKEATPYLYVPVSDQVRELAKELEVLFRTIYPVHTASQRRADAVFLKVPNESFENARQILGFLGSCKNRTFPPSFEDYYRRHETRAKVLNGLHEHGAEVLLDAGRGWTFEMPNCGDEAACDALRLKFGEDPLEHPMTLSRPDFPTSELVIFLEQYLPSDLEEVPGDLAHTPIGRLFCQLPVKQLDLLEAFRMGFCGIPAVRADFIFREWDLYPRVEQAHEQLIHLAEIIRATASPVAPHLVAISEQDEDLVFTIDGVTALLTSTLREALVALALLGRRGPILANTFSELAPSNDSDAGHNFNNKITLLKAVLPRLAYRSENGYRILQNIVFAALPSDDRMKKFLFGLLAADE